MCQPTTSVIETDEQPETGELFDSVDEELFLKNLSMFYLKLQAKLLLPASVIQTIIEEVQEVHDFAQLHLFSKLKEKLAVHGVADNAIASVT